MYSRKLGFAPAVMLNIYFFVSSLSAVLSGGVNIYNNEGGLMAPSAFQKKGLISM